MKIPPKPPKLREVLEKNPEEVYKLFVDQEAMAFAVKANKAYWHWEELPYHHPPAHIKLEQLWMCIKLLRISHHQPLNLKNYHFTFSLDDEAFQKLHLLDKSTAGQLLINNESINTEGKERYIINSLMEEAIASSQIEGASTTRRFAKELLRSRQKPKTQTQRMIVNGYQTMQHIIKLKENKIITSEMILELHRSITKDTFKKKEEEGRYRDNNEIIVGDNLILEKIAHVPPNYKEIPCLMEEFCKFASTDNESFIHPIIKGVILHFLIGFIHPFNDGNGRTARSIFYWYVLTRGYWLFEFMAVSRIIRRSKTQYDRAYLYTETDDNDLTYFINYHLKAIEEAQKEMIEYIQRKQKEQTEAMKFIHGLKEISLREAEILKQAIKHPEKMIVINEIRSIYGVVYQTARSDLLHLEKQGYLEKTKIKKKFIFKLAKGAVEKWRLNIK